MSMYKLTFPCELIDINGNIVRSEQTVAFDNKEELLEYVSGDTDGDNYGSALLRVHEYDNNLYANVGKMCNRIVHLLQLGDANVVTCSTNCVIDAWKE